MFNRIRTAVVSATAGLLAFASSPSPAVAQVRPPLEKPNIVFILADDLGYGDLSCMGQTQFSTPNIDRLATEGMKFTNHYCGSTVCMPSRASLFTGLHQGHVSVRGNRWNSRLLPDPQEVTVARVLKNAGYTTANFGKTGAANTETGGYVIEKGFDLFVGQSSHGAAHRQYPKFIVRNDEKIQVEGNDGRDGKVFANQLFFDETVKFIRENKSKPMFIQLSPTIPHADLNAPAEYIERFKGKFDEPKRDPPADPSKGYRFTPHPKATYAAMITYMDDQVGRVMQTLKDEGLDQNTVVIFASDNGAMREGWFELSWFNSSGTLRGGKRDLYEGGIRTPLLVRWPGQIAPGSTSDLPSAFWDFLPTAAELSGGTAPSGIDGISYAPTLLGKPDQQMRHDYLYWEFHEQGGKQAIRMGNWKGVRLQVGKDREAPIELYDLAADPSETTNVADAHPDVVKSIAKLMTEARSESADYNFKRD